MSRFSRSLEPESLDSRGRVVFLDKASDALCIHANLRKVRHVGKRISACNLDACPVLDDLFGPLLSNALKIFCKKEMKANQLLSITGS